MPAAAKSAMIGLAALLSTVPARAATTATGEHRTPAFAATLRQRTAQATPDRLVVTRTKNNLNNPTASPFRKTIADRATVAKLSADIAALPPAPSGIANCPNDLGIAYHLDFYAGSSALLAADYLPTGCASVRLSDGTVKSAAAGNFRADLRQALGFATDRQFLGFR
jgi:hypothetical protein